MSRLLPQAGVPLERLFQAVGAGEQKAVRTCMAACIADARLVQVAGQRTGSCRLGGKPSAGADCFCRIPKIYKKIRSLLLIPQEELEHLNPGKMLVPGFTFVIL